MTDAERKIWELLASTIFRRHEKPSERSFSKAKAIASCDFWNNDVLANPEGVHTVIAEHLREHHPHPVRGSAAHRPPPSRGRG
jgi:hypothetical protein